MGLEVCEMSKSEGVSDKRATENEKEKEIEKEKKK